MRRLLVLGLVAACGGGDDFHEVTATVSGVVEIGDPIAGAQVFADFHDDNIADQDAMATTDAAGHFTLVFENFGPLFPHSIVAVVPKDSISTGANMPVGFDVHLRAPLDVQHPTDGPATAADDVTVTGVVITPLTTIVVSEMGNDATLTRADAEAKVTAALTTSMLPLSGAPLDAMEDYVADPSDDAKQLRLAAAAFAGALGTAVSKLDAAQSYVEVNKATYFDPIVVALVGQLTAIANGTYMFTQVFTPAQQMDVVANPGNYTALFLDTAAAEAQLEAELQANQVDFEAEIESSLKDLLVELEQEFARFMAGELLYLAVEILGEAL